ncbi:ThiF family adenylyltransferase [Alkalihalobacterium bogoriense]|uniref:ThiF family adenylyltransferase n=1 Tax=Alkalihalobacterium bogoriense TaxID=246272 RepID=UPI0006867D0A|nr:ThiF family adenylyltransferase [Alkalihalobacterium bogoriense]
MDWLLSSPFVGKTVTLIGVGALGTVIASHLTRAGIGTLRLVDRDFVEESNLQRQLLFDEQDVIDHIPKVIAAKNKLEQINCATTIHPFIQDVNANTIESLVEKSDIIIDATDNMETRFLINEVSIKHNIPWVYGGAIQSRGMFCSIIPTKTPCLVCLFPGNYQSHGETCDTVGVLGPLVHIIGTYQATEALKIMTKQYDLVNVHLTQLDIWEFDYDQLPVERNPNCPCCVENEFPFLENKGENYYFAQLCGKDSIQITPTTELNINFPLWEQRWRKLGRVIRTPFLIKLYYEDYQLTLFQDGRLLIKGTQNEGLAKKLYSQFIGN